MQQTFTKSSSRLGENDFEDNFVIKLKDPCITNRKFYFVLNPVNRD